MPKSKASSSFGTGSSKTGSKSRKSRNRSQVSYGTWSDLDHRRKTIDFDPDRFFVVPRGVILEYGPYTFHGVCDFRVERLQGIQKSLEKLGARVKMITCTDHLNRVQVWYMDKVIFSCKITDLQHGGDGELDRLCTDAARAFDRASRTAIHGLRHRVNPENHELLDPFCPCINPNFFVSPAKDNNSKEKPTGSGLDITKTNSVGGSSISTSASSSWSAFSAN